MAKRNPTPQRRKRARSARQRKNRSSVRHTRAIQRDRIQRPPSMPLDDQVEQYLTLALEEAYRAGQTPVTPDLIDSVLAKGLNDVEPTLARYGYNARAVADLLHVQPADVRAFLRGRLPAGRAQEIPHELRAVGIPL